MGVFRIPMADFTSAINDLLSVKGMVEVEFDDGKRLAMSPRKLIFHLFFWKVARKYNVPITENVAVDTSVVNKKVLGDLGTRILMLIREKYPNHYQPVVHEFEEAFNRLSRFTAENCQAYHRSLSILDLVQIANLKEVKKIIDEPITRDTVFTSDQGEKILTKRADKLFAFLHTDHPLNTIRPFISLKFVSPTQLYHIFGQVGYRTDINDSIINYPVQGNYLNGLKDSFEYTLESLSAKKSIFYNKEAIPLADYFGRKQHLMLSILENIYPGDCGTKVNLPILVDETNRDSILWKNIVVGSNLVSLDHTNVDQFVGKTVQARSPLGCRHQDGVCEVCVGRLLSNSIPGVQIGVFSALQATERIVQTILSSKHLQSTKTVEYIVPEELRSIILEFNNAIYIKPAAIERWKSAQLALKGSNALRLMNIPEHNIKRTNSISEASFGRVGEIMLMRNHEPVTDIISMESDDQRPYYSKYLIKYISDNFDKRTKAQDDLFIIDLKDFDFEKPLFRTPVINAAMVNFVKSVSNLLEKELSSYTSGIELYNVVHNLVHQQVRVNSAYLEMVLRAVMISDEYDFRLPIVEDLDNVKFGTNANINRGRSIGILTAFETLSAEIISPRFYLQPKQIVRFDHFLNLKPRNLQYQIPIQDG